jgi:hypothetical protein
MHKLIVPIAAVAALAFLGIDAAPAQAQVVFGGGYIAPGYSSGFTPAGYGYGYYLGNGGATFNASPIYGGIYGGGRIGYPNYGYGGSYYGNSYYGGYGSRGYYGGYRGNRWGRRYR